MCSEPLPLAPPLPLASRATARQSGSKPPCVCVTLPPPQAGATSCGVRRPAKRYARVLPAEGRQAAPGESHGDLANGGAKGSGALGPANGVANGSREPLELGHAGSDGKGSKDSRAACWRAAETLQAETLPTEIQQTPCANPREHPSTEAPESRPPTEATSTEATPREATPTEVLPTEALPTKAAPTEAPPLKAAPAAAGEQRRPLFERGALHRARSILNKLTPERFERLLPQCAPLQQDPPPPLQ